MSEVIEREEKIKKIISKLQDSLKSLNGEHNHITGFKIPVNIKDYFPSENDPFGSFIRKLYVDKVEIISPLTPIYSMWNTPIHSYDVHYSKLTPEDLDAVYKDWVEG
jgi:hypothetical protein